jgi:hypothetical protein
MEDAARGIYAVMAALEEAPTVEAALVGYVQAMETAYAESKDIALFVFAVRTFFCWHRAADLTEEAGAIERIREVWVEQNENAYTKWLASMEDNPDGLKWAKWTFQAKTSILTEFLEGLAEANLS